METTGTFKSTLSNIEVHSDGDGNYGTINFLAKGIEYNGLGAAPVFNLSAFGDPNADSKTPVSIEITGNQGLTFGS
ncbi:MAG: hypothetical protein HC898_07450 [Phycisphaerales bacterium]|nr:hypothetical protein [Phycisphaerales bacterium]